MRIIVTGGLGFIGSNFINHFLTVYPAGEIINIDKGGIGANPANVIPSPRVTHLKRDIAEPGAFADLPKVDAVFHFAAESHVDRSLETPTAFAASNVIGTLNVLEYCRKNGVRLVAISTDEVYGSIDEGSATEMKLLEPGNPYSASKASADLFCLVYHNSYGVDVVITRCGNNFGPGQYEEKLIPKTIKLGRFARLGGRNLEGRNQFDRGYAPPNPHRSPRQAFGGNMG